MTVALGTLAKKNALGGIAALIAFNVPGAILLMILGYIYSKYPDPRDLNILIFLAI
jgi:chromate transport protein ChrA